MRTAKCRKNGRGAAGLEIVVDVCHAHTQRAKSWRLLKCRGPLLEAKGLMSFLLEAQKNLEGNLQRRKTSKLWDALHGCRA